MNYGHYLFLLLVSSYSEKMHHFFLYFSIEINPKFILLSLRCVYMRLQIPTETCRKKWIRNSRRRMSKQNIMKNASRDQLSFYKLMSLVGAFKHLYCTTWGEKLIIILKLNQEFIFQKLQSTRRNIKEKLQ